MSTLRNVIEYRHNNSGGSWWLTDDDWYALEAAGWIVHWQHDESEQHGDLVHEPSQWPSLGHHHGYTHPLVPVQAPPRGKREGRQLGALATSAAKETADPAATVAEWERITGQSASDEGCNCCGSPHSFTFYNHHGESQYTSVEVTDTRLVWN